MFKFLKKKLFGVEKELEKALEDQIEKELAQARKAPPAAPAAVAPPTPPKPPAAAAPTPPPLSPPPAKAPEPAPAPTRAPAPPPMPTPAPAPREEPGPQPTPAVPAPPPADPPRPSGYKEAKRLGVLEDEQRKSQKESIEQRLERELREAVQTQKAIETVQGEGTKILLPADKLEDLLWELELGLLESDVALPVIEAIKSSVREQLTVTGVRRGRAEEIVEDVLRTAIKQVLEAGKFDFDAFIQNKLKEKKPVVVMFVGVNGTGKTTTIAKIAHRLKGMNITTVLAAGDTFRAGAIEQLTVHADRLGVKIIKHSAGSDPAAVAYDAIEHAKSRHKDVVLLDTAGRMQTNKNLMDEMAKIRRVARPDMTIFVGDALAGNDAVEQASNFNQVVGIDGVVLTKVDADAKGGAALSVAYTIGKPLLFIGIGQEYDQQIPFNAEWMVDRLFGAQAKAELEAEA